MLKDHRKILVGLDLDARGNGVTDGAHKACQQAIWLARTTDASIRFVHSIYQDDYRTPLGGSQGIVHEGLPEQGEQALAAMVSLARNVGLEAELVITEGRPWLDMIQMVTRGEVDWVVVGKRNRSDNDGRKLGSCATKLLRKCPCPVWVIKPEHDLKHENLLAATDLTEVGDQAVGLAHELSEQMQCQLHVVHAWQMPISLQLNLEHDSEAEHKQEVQAFEQGILRHIRDHLPERARKSTLIEISMGTPASIIGQAVSHLNPDLLVMGTVSRTGIAGLLLGSTAERMLGHVDCSILAIKPEGFESPIKP